VRRNGYKFIYPKVGAIWRVRKKKKKNRGENCGGEVLGCRKRWGGGALGGGLWEAVYAAKREKKKIKKLRVSPGRGKGQQPAHSASAQRSPRGAGLLCTVSKEKKS